MKHNCAPQYVGLPYMAHEYHAEDTLSIIAEPDFRFTNTDATSQTHWWEHQESVLNRYADWDEVCDSLPDKDQAAFRRDLERWVAAQRLDQNAPWPSDAEADPTGLAEDFGEWCGERIDWGEHVSFAYTRPRRPPVTAFQLENMSNYLHVLHALFTAGCRVSRAGFGWFGWCAAQWGERGA